MHLKILTSRNNVYLALRLFLKLLPTVAWSEDLSSGKLMATLQKGDILEIFDSPNPKEVKQAPVRFNVMETTFSSVEDFGKEFYIFFMRGQKIDVLQFEASKNIKKIREKSEFASLVFTSNTKKLTRPPTISDIPLEKRKFKLSAKPEFELDPDFPETRCGVSIHIEPVSLKGGEITRIDFALCNPTYIVKSEYSLERISKILGTHFQLPVSAK